jgi:hypothetical protein
LECLSENCCDLVHCALLVITENHFGLLQNELWEELELLLGLLDIMGNRQQTNPSSCKLSVNFLVLFNKILLILKHFTQAGNSVVSSMVELSWLRLLGVYLSGHLVINCAFEWLQACLEVSCECFTAMLGNNTDTIGCCLTETCTLVVCELANSLDNNLILVGSKVGWS